MMIVKTISKLRALKAEKMVTSGEIIKKLGWAETSDKYLSKIMNEREYVGQDQIQKIADAILEIAREQEIECEA